MYIVYNIYCTSDKDSFKLGSFIKQDKWIPKSDPSLDKSQSQHTS